MGRFAEEGAVRLVSAIVCDARKDAGPAIVAGDRAGNVCRFECDLWRERGADPHFFGAPKRIKLAWNYCIGEAVPGAFGGFMALDGRIPDSEQRVKAAMTENLKLLRAVELALIKCDEFAFGNACFPATGTIDLDLLEWFSKISQMKGYFWQWRLVFINGSKRF
jgi:hypothetical protein